MSGLCRFDNTCSFLISFSFSFIAPIRNSSRKLTMSTNEAWLLEQKLEILEPEKLFKFAHDLQIVLLEKTTEISKLRSKLTKTENEMRSRSQTSEAEISKHVEKQQILLSKLTEQETHVGSQSTRNWIRAELDYPEDVSWSWFSRKAQTVLVYDSSCSTLETRSIETLHGKSDPANSVSTRFLTFQMNVRSSPDCLHTGAGTSMYMLRAWQQLSGARIPESELRPRIDLSRDSPIFVPFILIAFRWMLRFEFCLARLSGYLFCTIPEIRESQLDPRLVLNHLQLSNRQFDGAISTNCSTTVISPYSNAS